jgi:predicted ATPase/class 3 adenylate cyclase
VSDVGLPSGTVTFLFTDLAVSTRLWEQEPDAMRAAMARHDELLRAAIELHGGFVVKGRGDGVHAAFSTADSAVLAAVDCQLAMDAETWALSEPLRVRIGIHTGVAELRDGDYFGSAVNRAARLEGIAHGGQIVCSQATADLARDALPEGIELLDLGEHRLRDLSRPERVFQVNADRLEARFAPLQSLDAFPGNLPLQLSSFVGREEELRRVAKALEASRVVTLTGVGGVGKTRLATQVAAEVLPAFPDGAWLCELAAAGDGEAMVELIAATLGVVQRPGVTREESIVEYLRPKELLVVLDNCEHVLAAAGELVEELLRACSWVRVIATSREGLAIDGEQLWPLRSLAVPRPNEAVDRSAVATSAAVRLFVDRATAARPDFRLDDTNTPAVVEICRRLDGVPLAIELAAARVVSMTPGDIAGLLDERFRLLSGGRRNTVERHQTLRATVEWSFSLLDDTERAVFDRLGVFSGTFDAEAAVAVASGDGIDAWDARDALASLVAKSMVVVDETAHDVTRYDLLETMRQYALERLSVDGDVDAARRRHAEHYAAVAEAMGPALMGPDELSWRPRFRAALDNLRAAFTCALDSPGTADAELAVRIVAALADQAPHDQAAGIGAWAERAVEAAERSTPGRRTAVLGAAASSATYKADIELQISYGDRALRDGIPPDCPAPAPAIMFRSLAADDDRLEQLVADAAELEAIGAPAYNLTHTLAAEALRAYQFDQHERAQAAATRAVAWARVVANPTGLAASLSIYAMAFAEEDSTVALAAAQESIALTRAGASNGVYSLALGVAARLLAEHDRAAALGYLRDVLTFFLDIGNPLDLDIAVFSGTHVLAQLGESEVAAVFFGIWSSSLALTHPYLAVPVPDVLPIAELQAALGDGAYDAAAARGTAFTLDAAVEYVRLEVDRLLAAENGTAG